MALEHSGYFRAAEEAYGNAIAIDDSYEKALQNFARVEFVEEDAQLIPIDLQTMSQDFVAEIVSWSDENIPREQPFVEPAENEITSLIQPDSVAVQIENKN
ncbi:MAG: hypothetical protein HKN13_01330 [Rhodothermales bacterium]|nr:hypothetical protein [Rhodothermales bacterium]